MTTSGVFDVRQLHSSEVAPYQELHLLALRANPEAFGSSFEEEASWDDAVFAERLSKGTIFGAWLGEALVGSAGLALRDKMKLRHKGILWGMFVRPEVRGRGAAKQLLSAILAHARTHCEEVLLTVVEGNHAACGLYLAAGFVEYEREPAAIKIGTDYHHELLMRLPLGRQATPITLPKPLGGTAKLRDLSLEGDIRFPLVPLIRCHGRIDLSQLQNQLERLLHEGSRTFLDYRVRGPEALVGPLIEVSLAA